MEMSSEEKILGRSISLMFDAHGKEWKPDVIATWVQLIRKCPVKYPLEKWIGAINVAIYSADAFPSIGKLMASMKPDTRTDAETAWDSVLKHISRRGSDTPIDDVRLSRAVKAVGGLYALGMTDDEGLVFKRKEFLEQWERVAEKDFVEAIGTGNLGLLGSK